MPRTYIKLASCVEITLHTPPFRVRQDPVSKNSRCIYMVLEGGIRRIYSRVTRRCLLYWERVSTTDLPGSVEKMLVGESWSKNKFDQLNDACGVRQLGGHMLRARSLLYLSLSDSIGPLGEKADENAPLLRSFS